MQYPVRAGAEQAVLQHPDSRSYASNAPLARYSSGPPPESALRAPENHAHPQPIYAPFVFNGSKDDMRTNYGEINHQYALTPAQEDQDYRERDNYARGDRSNPMVLSNPIPDYSVASGSSPFTLQPQAPHFQPRPRPIMNVFPTSRRDYDPNGGLPHQHQQQPQHQLGQDPRNVQYGDWDYNNLRNDGRIPDMMAQPGQGVPMAYGLPHQQMLQQQARDPYRPMLPNGQLDSHDSLYQPQDQLSLSNDEDTDAGKKQRKRRRLKGELPRDHALRKYKCNDCEQKFARPSALATHVLTHTKEKPFVCETCNRGFAVMSNLRRHARVRHERDPGTTSPPLAGGSVGPRASTSDGDWGNSAV